MDSCPLALAVAVLLFAGHQALFTSSIEGLKQSSNFTIHAGRNTSIRCVTETDSPVNCVWQFENPQRNRTPTIVAGFQAHGPNSTDCTIDLLNVSLIQTGWWTCRAQYANNTILQSSPIFLHVLVSPEIIFDAKPANRTLSIGGPADLECKTSLPVQTCQWSFQQRGQTEPLVVTEGPPKDAKDCSFRLEHVSYEQAGKWRCGARTDDSDKFTYTPTAYIQVEHKEEAFPVEFMEEPADTELGLGQTGRLRCRVRKEAHIEGCRWYWRPVGHGPAWTLLMREFLPVDNDCSVEFANVTADPEGLWTCHVKPIHSNKFKPSKPAKLTVRGEVTVSTLTREVSVIEGEPLTIFCIAETAVKNCQWKKKLLFETVDSDGNPWSIVESFPANGNYSRDCSLRLGHVRAEHQGLWVCTLQVFEDSPFYEAMPSAVTVKSPSFVKFVEPSRTQLAAEGSPVRLNCSTLSAVRECVWTWYEDESKLAERVVKYNFSVDPLNRLDCGVEVPRADRSLQGVWQCAVRFGEPGALDTGYARPFSLTVVKTGPIQFREVSEGLQTVPGGGSGRLLTCVTREPVAECLWLYREPEAAQPLEYARFEPVNFNNCSLAVDRAGVWTCGARNPDQTNFTMAASAIVDVVHPGNVTTLSLLSSDDTLTLACHLPAGGAGVACHWMHPSGYDILEFNTTGKYELENSAALGHCSVRFRPLLVDEGHWRCVFTVNNRTHAVGEASFIILSSPQNVRLSWVVGVLATVTLLLTLLLSAAVACRFCACARHSNASVQLQHQPLPEAKRYSEDPTKGINFSFTESPELLVDLHSAPAEGHHYERVGRCLEPRPSFYQNVNLQ